MSTVIACFMHVQQSSPCVICMHIACITGAVIKLLHSALHACHTPLNYADPMTYFPGPQSRKM